MLFFSQTRRVLFPTEYLISYISSLISWSHADNACVTPVYYNHGNTSCGTNARHRYYTKYYNNILLCSTLFLLQQSNYIIIIV